MIALLVIALDDGQNGPYRNAPVPWQEPTVPAKAGKDLSLIDPVSVSLNGSVLERSFTALCFVQNDMKRRFSRFLTHNKRRRAGASEKTIPGSPIPRLFDSKKRPPVHTLTNQPDWA